MVFWELTLILDIKSVTIFIGKNMKIVEGDY